MKPRMETLSAERLKQVLRYDPDTGEFFNVCSGRKRVIGAKAGSVSRDGYVKLCIDRQIYFGHRLAWLYTHGRFPTKFIDHINRNRQDNRIANLRECDYADNQHNSIKPKKAGRLVGAFKRNKRHPLSWYSEIRVNGKDHFLGNFATELDAHRAYMDAKQRLHPTYAPQDGDSQ